MSVTTAIDLFAGAGGFTTGAEAAGVSVLWAGNHWQAAVDTHAANHPGTDHVCQDLHQADWNAVPVTDLVLASPSCQGFSRARGRDRAHHDAARSTAWAVVSCVERHEPKGFVVENVAAFREWKLWPAWRLAMESLGYHLTDGVLDAADFGVPQHRERVFVVGTRDVDFELPVGTAAHVGIDSVIDWPSGSWSDVKKPGRATATLARWEAGRAKCGDRFVMPFYGSGSGKTGRDLARPIGTVTTRDRWALVDGDRLRMLTPAEYRAAMGFPSSYRLPAVRKTAIHLLGNAVCPPVVEAIVGRLAAAVA